MSAATMEPIREVLAFETEKRTDAVLYRDMTEAFELGHRAFAALIDGEVTR